MPVLQAAVPALREAPAPRLATMRVLAERSRIADGALRTALSRACAAGSLVLDDGRYSLGPLAKEEAASARALRSRVRGYVLALVQEGQAGHLPRLHEVFARNGFRPLQRSVWIGARTRDDRLGPALARAGLGQAVLVFPSDEVGPETRAHLQKHWGLTARAAELRAFERRLLRHLDAPSLARDEAAWRCVEVAPTWYRVTLREEPPFPLDLCGPDYPLDALNAAWRSHLEAKATALVAIWTRDAA